MSNEQKHTYKLIYFNSRGRGEPIRLVLRYFNVDFEDHRMENDEVADLKNKAPMKQFPYLEIDGGKTTLCQTMTICRYLGKSLQPDRWFGGATKTDSARVDMYAEAFTDVFNMVASAYSADEEDKERSMKKAKMFMKERLEILQDLLKKSKKDFFVGKTVHWCDLYILGIMGTLEDIDSTFLDDLPELKAYYLRMRNQPEIKNYIDENWPETKYSQ